MIDYIKNPPIFHARWFTGGRENATAVTGFLADLDIHSMWYAERRDENDEPVFAERLVIELGDMRDIVVLPTQWIVVGTDTQVLVLSDEEFHKQYSIAPTPIRH